MKYYLIQSRSQNIFHSRVPLSFCSAHVPLMFPSLSSSVSVPRFRPSLLYSFCFCPFGFLTVPMTFYFRPIYVRFLSILFVFVHFRFSTHSVPFRSCSFFFVFFSSLGFFFCSMHVPTFSGLFLWSRIQALLYGYSMLIVLYWNKTCIHI
jgi:hypothetical protein